MKMDFLEKNYIKIKLKYLKKAKVEYILSNILTILTVLATAIYPMLLSYIVDNYNSLNSSTLVYIFGILILSIIFLLMCTYFNKITDKGEFLNDFYIKDNDYVYCNEDVLNEADPKTFKVVNQHSSRAEDKNHKYEYCKVVK